VSKQLVAQSDRTRARLAQWQRRFLAALRLAPNVQSACKAARVSRQTAYRHKAEDTEFRDAWQEAIDASLDELEATAFRKAKEGDAQLITWLLRCHRPQVYRERSEVAVAGGIVFLPQKSTGDE